MKIIPVGATTTRRRGLSGMSADAVGNEESDWSVN